MGRMVRACIYFISLNHVIRLGALVVYQSDTTAKESLSCGF